MIGRKVKWLQTFYGSTGEPTYSHGVVVAEWGDFIVCRRTDKSLPSHSNPFVTKRCSEVE